MDLDAMIVLQSDGARELLELDEDVRMKYMLDKLEGYSMEEYIIDMVDFYEIDQARVNAIHQVIDTISTKKVIYEDGVYLVYMLSLQYILQNFSTILPMRNKCNESDIEKCIPVKSKKNAKLLIILENNNLNA